MRVSDPAVLDIWRMIPNPINRKMSEGATIFEEIKQRKEINVYTVCLLVIYQVGRLWVCMANQV